MAPVEFPENGPRNSLEIPAIEESSVVDVAHSDRVQRRGGSFDDSREPERRRSSYPQTSSKSTIKHWAKGLIFRRRATLSTVLPSPRLPPGHQPTPGAASSREWRSSVGGSPGDRVTAAHVPSAEPHSNGLQDDETRRKTLRTVQDVMHCESYPGDTASHQQPAILAAKNKPSGLQSEAPKPSVHRPPLGIFPQNRLPVVEPPKSSSNTPSAPYLDAPPVLPRSSIDEEKASEKLLFEACVDSPVRLMRSPSPSPVLEKSATDL